MRSSSVFRMRSPVAETELLDHVAVSTGSRRFWCRNEATAIHSVDDQESRLAMIETTNQHYVPQFYLSSFSVDATHVWAFDKFTNKSFAPNIRNVAAEQFFYDVPPASNPFGNPRVVEETLSELESHYVSAIRDLLDEVRQNRRFSPGRSPRNEVLAHFLLIQACRTREFRDTMTDAYRKLMIASKDMRAFMKKKLADKGEEVMPDREALPEMTPLDQARFMFDGPFVAAVLPMLFNHLWLVGDNQTPHLLYTSDAPVALCPHGEQSQGAGFLSPGIEIMLPLSSRYILVLLDREYFKLSDYLTDGIVHRLHPNQVLHYNTRQVFNSRRQIYCQEDKFDFARQMITEIPELCDPNQSRIEIS
jgi:hypothetical protein